MTDANHERAQAALPEYPRTFDKRETEGTLVERFDKIVARHADRLAIDDGRRALTYAQLGDETDRLAGALVDRLGPAAEPVALLYRHGSAFHVAQLGVFKAGKFYASLDAELAPHRLSMLLENLGTRLLLCDSACEPLARELASASPGLAVLNTNAELRAAAGRPTTSLTPDSIAYIIYTSGSTGAPEGVVVSHRHVLHHARMQTDSLHVGPDDRCAQICPLSSAAATGEIFPPLLNGGAVFPFAVKSAGVNNIAGLARWLKQKEITLCTSVPVLFRLLTKALGKSGSLPHLRLMRLSGDRILPTDIELFKKHFAPGSLLRAAYGSSECYLATQFFIDHAYDGVRAAVPAGYAVRDAEVFIVDDQLNRLGPGEQGEIAVRSRYHADGYWRNPKRTSERFMVDREDPSKKLYLSRDLGYLEHDGCLIHLGRTDFRVKVYGKWVAVTELEEALLALPDVREAVVVASAGPHGNELAAYYTTGDGADVPSAAIDAAMRRFPTEVVPKRFVRLEEMPVTPSNKIDRKGLAERGNPEKERA
ncbi:MAG TPA: AMP-binding protein [Gammaproteobacteria bacterium]|nr:AMP-binding protein [Gammaproteobacteria bacterium]